MEEMREPSFEYFAERFLSAFYHSFNKFLAPDARSEIVEFLIHHITGVSMHLSFTPADILTVSDSVFKNANVRDFCFILSSNFFARIETGQNEWYMLADRLAKSYSMVEGPAGMSADVDMVPSVISARLPKIKNIQEYMMSNRWLLVLAMIDQVISLADIQKMAPETPVRRMTQTLPIAASA